VRNIAVSVSVCMSVSWSIPKTTCPDFMKFFVHVMYMYSRGSDFRRRQCNIRYVLPILAMTSFFHIMEPESKTMTLLNRVRQVAAPRAKLLSVIVGLLTIVKSKVVAFEMAQFSNKAIIEADFAPVGNLLPLYKTIMTSTSPNNA